MDVKGIRVMALELCAEGDILLTTRSEQQDAQAVAGWDMRSQNEPACRPSCSGAFSIIIKPHGPICNLDCTYCYYLSKEKLYWSSTGFRMSKTTLEELTRQYITSQDTLGVTFFWQGGEPTLMGLQFYKDAVALQEKYRSPGMLISNAFQTNGMTLDEAWCEFFREHRFLVGLSLDGPMQLHDHFRKDKSRNPTFHKVMRALRLLQDHHVEFNVLCVVNRVNADYPLEVYKFLKEQGVTHIQFIPAVGRQPDGSISSWTVGAEQYGRFLCTIFDEWVDNDVGKIFVQAFEVPLAAWMGLEPSLCSSSRTCGRTLVVEHNGDVYACDHFVTPEYLLGNIHETHLGELAALPFQRRFGAKKYDSLPRYCRECPVLLTCNGGCPKDRFIVTPDGEPGLNYLCAGYKRFFTHIVPYVQRMASDLQLWGWASSKARGSDVSARRAKPRHKVGRNDPCPCGSGKKYKRCCLNAN